MDNKTNKHEFACNAGKVTEYEVTISIIWLHSDRFD